MSVQKSYQLFINLPRDLYIDVGKLGPCFFPGGDYVYTGSARRHMEARLARHLKRDKKKHWHIDYLTSHPEVSIMRILRSDNEECRLNQLLDGRTILEGLGASDCREDCGSHLKYVSNLQERDYSF